MLTKRLSVLLLTLPLAGCMGDNMGLESVHQPVVANGAASVPNCPDWSSQRADSAALTDSNYGCATNANLAAMVADPNDLIHGRAEASDAEVATRAVRAWREQAPSGKGTLEKVSSKGGQ